MTAPARLLSDRRGAVLFSVAVLIEILLVFRAGAFSSDDPFGMLVMIALVAPVGLALVAMYPGVAVCLVPLLVVIPGHFQGIIAAQWALLAVVVVAALRAIASGVIPRAPRGIEVIFAVYLVWAGLSTSQAVDTRDAFGGLARIITFFIAFVAGSRLAGGNRARSMVRAAAAVSVLVALELLLVVRSSGFSLAYLASHRGALTDLGWGHSNYVAAVATLSAAAAIPLALYGRGGDRLLGVGGVLAAVSVATFTLSRGGTLALAIGLSLAAAIELRRRIAWIVALAAIVVPAYLFSPVGQASLARFANPGDFLSIGARLIFWQDTIRIAAENPVLGIGPNQLPFHTHYIIGANPHNFVLKNAVEFGLPGVILYLSMLFSLGAACRRFLRSARTAESRAPALSMALLLGVAIANSLYEPALVGAEYGVLFWLVMGSLFARAEGAARDGAPLR